MTQNYVLFVFIEIEVGQKNQMKIWFLSGIRYYINSVQTLRRRATCSDSLYFEIEEDMVIA